MPITKSAIKALRKSERNREKNLKRSGAYKKAVKDFRVLIKEKNLNEVKKSLPAVFKSLDKAARTNVIKKNKASRLKSRLSLALNKIQNNK